MLPVLAFADLHGEGRPLPGPDWAWEPILPGYSFFRQNRPLAASLIIGGRIVSLASMLAYQQQSARYASAEAAAKNADIYYGPGLRYRDPYSGSYRTSRDFRNIADRNMNLASYSAALHILLLGIGVFNGMQNEDIYRQERAPVVETAFHAVPARSACGEWSAPGSGLFRLTIPLDF